MRKKIISMQIEIDGIKIDVQKKKIKNIYLRVNHTDGKVYLSAPLFLSDESISKFVYSKLDWVKNQQQKVGNQPEQAEIQYVSGENIYVFGEKYTLRVEYSDRCKSFVINGEEAVLTVKKGSTVKQREAVVKEWYRAVLKSKIEIYLPKWEEITGLHPTSWQIKHMKTRWGTCNIKTRKIWLNLQLAQKPTECLEYVILHELAHLKVSNHGKDFIRIMDKYMPCWRDVKKKLK